MPADPVLDLEAEMADLWRRSRVRMRALSREVHPQLDPAAYPLVVVLARSGPLRIGDLGAALELDKSTASRQVDSLVRLGLAVRLADARDARARLVGLTPEGHARIGHLQAEQVRRWRESLTAWPEDDVAQLTALLHRLGATGLT